MRLIVTLSTLVSSLILSACMHKGSNPADPYEPINREIYKFNMAFDATMLKPTARLYKTVIPAPVRIGINNAFNNVAMIPTVASDLLQGDWRYAIKDSWRFFFNSTFGIAGILDVADHAFNLPPHYNDLGLTFAKWGDKKSPYIVIPFLGPSTIRDGVALPFNYMLMPYAYITSSVALYSLMGSRYVDLRAQLFDTEPLMDEAFDKYTFIRDAYLQHRNSLINGEQPNTDTSGYVDEADAEVGGDYIDDKPTPSNQKQPSMSLTENAAHRPVSARNSTQHR
ncbi:MlaA family lipoprotein [Legionella fairfieldensis]|uniref:MlaA family lipoprotein n=1 Tax=Legionella fairfieldensis TaxID=45064 RepID=UPI0009FC754F|nr:VacJ family lipoprotein [Legionella fairfieldensis]